MGRTMTAAIGGGRASKMAISRQESIVENGEKGQAHHEQQQKQINQMQQEAMEKYH